MPMKIAFLSTFYPYRGGIAQFNASLFRALEKNHTVKLVNFSLQYPSFLFPGTTQYVNSEDKADALASSRILNAINPLSYFKTAREIIAYKPDLLIIGYWMPFMGPCLGYVSGKLAKKTKVITIVHNAVPHEQSKLDRVLSNYFFKRTQHVIALSEAVKKDINHAYPSVKVDVIPHPSYTHFGNPIEKEQALAQLNLPSDKKILLFFGLIRAYKGLDILIEAMRFLDETYHLVIAGEAYEDWDKYQQQLEKNNLSTRIHLHTRYIPDHEVPMFFSAADCCVLPYKSATQSGIVAIAQAFNLPVIASNVGGLSEFIQDGKNGILLSPPLTGKHFAETIKKVVESNLLKTMRAELKTSSNQFTWDNFASSLLNLSNCKS